MTQHAVSLETLHARFDTYAEGRAQGLGAVDAYREILDRLAENQRVAEARGWTACALERAAGFGRLRVWGVPPGRVERHMIPDWRATT